MGRLERQIDKLVGREAALHADLAAAATDPGRLVELGGELKRVVAEKEMAESDWLTAAELAQ